MARSVSQEKVPFGIPILSSKMIPWKRAGSTLLQACYEMTQMRYHREQVKALRWVASRLVKHLANLFTCS